MELNKHAVEIKKRAEKLLEKKDIILIGIAGGSGSGKSFLACNILKEFDSVLIKMDDYYIRGICKDNKDIPDALNLDLLREHLIMLKKGKEITKPVYTFALKKDTIEKIMPKRLIILDGLFALHEKFLDILDCKVFVDCNEEKRLARRLKRDVEERGYTKEDTLKRWNDTVNPMYIKHVMPTRGCADIVIES